MNSLRKGWKQVISFENLLRAYERDHKSKRSGYGVQRFELERERNLLALYLLGIGWLSTRLAA